MKDYIQSNKKGLILVFIATIIMVTIFTLDNKKLNEITVDYNASIVENKKEITEEEQIELMLKENNDSIAFFANVFQIDSEVLLDTLKNDSDIDLLDSNDDFDKFLIDYLFNLEKNNKKLFKKDITPCDKSKEYMISLISYYSNVYENVDFNIAAAIAEIESGYTAKGMLKRNNIFGGMSNGSLIRYKNIEYGILSYIKLLSEGYFGKGLTTVDAIGKVYNPMINEKGVKVAKPTWVRNVNNAMEKYQETTSVKTVSELITLQELA